MEHGKGKQSLELYEPWRERRGRDKRIEKMTGEKWRRGVRAGAGGWRWKLRKSTDSCEVTWIFTGQRICFPGEMARRRRPLQAQ